MSPAGTAVRFPADLDMFGQEPGEFIPFRNFAETLGVLAFFTYVLLSPVDALDGERQMSRYDAQTGIVDRRHSSSTRKSRSAARGASGGRSRRPASTWTPRGPVERAGGDALPSRLSALLLRETADTDTPGFLGVDGLALLMSETGYDAARASLSGLGGRIAALLAESGRPGR